jgi:hypothetical protein
MSRLRRRRPNRRKSNSPEGRIAALSSLFWCRQSRADRVAFRSGMTPFPPRRFPSLGPGKRSARQQVLAQWRGVDLTPLEKAKALTAKPVSASLPKVLSDLRIDKRRSEAEILKVWNHLIEPDVVTHAQPVGYRNGTLFVNVDSNVWLSEIVRHRRKEILERLRHSFGPDFVVRISFRVG